MKDTSSRLARALGNLLGLDQKSVAELVPAEREKVVKWLYDILGILDAKSSHVLRTSAISLAAQTFLVSMILNGRLSFPILGGAYKTVLVASLLVPLVASVVALNVFRVEWLFLEKCNEHGSGIRDEIEALALACDRRTTAHRRAWYLSMAAAATLASIILIATWAAWESGATPGTAS